MPSSSSTRAIISGDQKSGVIRSLFGGEGALSKIKVQLLLWGAAYLPPSFSSRPGLINAKTEAAEESRRKENVKSRGKMLWFFFFLLGDMMCGNIQHFVYNYMLDGTSTLLLYLFGTISSSSPVDGI